MKLISFIFPVVGFDNLNNKWSTNIYDLHFNVWNPDSGYKITCVFICDSNWAILRFNGTAYNVLHSSVALRWEKINYFLLSSKYEIDKTVHNK